MNARWCCCCSREGHHAHVCPDGAATRANGRLPALLAVPQPDTPAALILLAKRRAAWSIEHPTATAEQELAAAAEIAKELGL